MLKILHPRFLVLLLLAMIIGLFYFFDLSIFFNFNYIKSEQQNLIEYYQNFPLKMILLFSLVYITCAALCLPGALLLSLLAGAIFGVFLGTILVSFSSTIGATIAFLISRYMFRDLIQNKFATQLSTFNQGIEKDGGAYLFSLRLVPAFPFFLVNLLMGITTIKISRYYLISQIGMLPASFLIVNAGTQLSKLENVTGILSPTILVSFAVLGFFPFIMKKIMVKINYGN